MKSLKQWKTVRNAYVREKTSAVTGKFNKSAREFRKANIKFLSDRSEDHLCCWAEEMHFSGRLLSLVQK